ncbi:hypothetical protein AruPA_19575 [Acidiphilium sp. PA]|uniref:hypothetical protein n=1 Tax=Acidiphilium sp. PA TaxID=2871705 RepID=UPI0022434F2B|nr:hypothetical protein [Acidiphilium sp. PA]MCW8309237.1 hypothetical protein [Acidiphilium sp. PA]
MIDTIDVEAPPATATDYESDPDDDQGFGLSWVAVFLIDLSYGGSEEGCWRYPAGILAIDPWVYEILGAAPAGFCSIAAADVHARRLRAKLPEANQARPDISQTNSVGQYNVRVMRAQSMPTHFPRIRPSYE